MNRQRILQKIRAVSAEGKGIVALYNEISAIVEKSWKAKKSDELMQSLSERRADPYTLAGEIMENIIK